MKTDLENYEANNCLTALMLEAGEIIREHPDLGIGRIAVNEYGLHTFHIGADAKSEKLKNGPDALLSAVTMVQSFPAVEAIVGDGFAAIFDALTASIETISGIISQPRCNSGENLSAAGEYLEKIEDFLLFERRRIMKAAAAATNTERDDGDHVRLKAVLQFKAVDADLTYDQAVNMIAAYDQVEARS